MVLKYINMNPPQVYTCSSFQIVPPPPSPYHPSGSSQCTSPEHPVSCIEPGLAICFLYDVIHVSMPFSQIIPPSPSPTESKRLFYTSVFLCCLTYRVIITIFLNSIYMCWVKWVKSLSRVRLFATPQTVAYQAPLSMGFSKQECWSGLPFPSLGDLPNPGIRPRSPALQTDALPSEPPGKPLYVLVYCIGV